MVGTLVSLKGWKFLGNNGVTLEYGNKRGIKAHHYVPPNGLVTIPEAAQILGTNEVQLHRLRRAKKIKTRLMRGVTALPVSELLRLRRDPDALYPGRAA